MRRLLNVPGILLVIVWVALYCASGVIGIKAGR